LGKALRLVRDLIFVSATVWALTLPLVIARFHLLSPVALVLNPLLWIPMAIALAAGFGVLAFGWLIPPLARLCGTVSSEMLRVLDSSIATARELPMSHFWLPGPANWWLAGFYGGLAVLAAFPAIRPPRRWCLALLGTWTAIGFAVPLVENRRADLQCTFLSVGHGAAVVVQLPSGQTMLFDAGQFSLPEFGARTVASCLWSHGRTHIDAVVLSHSDADHYNALPGLLERFSVGVVYVSPVMFQEDNSALDALRREIRQAGVPIKELFAGDRLRCGPECLIEVLHPPERGLLGSDNANCVVLAMEYQGQRFLLPADLEHPGLDDLLADEPWDCEVLMAPHHGSQHSDPPGLADWCQPEWVVISGGHPTDAEVTTRTYRERGARVFHTAKTGAVLAAIHSGKLQVRQFLIDP
jgi:competence protein ComEC